jgi:hypothetical protein
MAWAETEWWANRVIGGSAPVITKNTDYNNIILCKTITQGSTNNNINWVCTYRKWEDVLRYIYLY